MSFDISQKIDSGFVEMTVFEKSRKGFYAFVD